MKSKSQDTQDTQDENPSTHASGGQDAATEPTRAPSSPDTGGCWVPVGERLPNDHRPVYAALKWPEVVNAEFWRERWHFPDDAELSGEDVTHWQAIPDPPDHPTVSERTKPADSSIARSFDRLLDSMNFVK